MTSIDSMKRQSLSTIKYHILQESIPQKKPQTTTGTRTEMTLPLDYDLKVKQKKVNSPLFNKQLGRYKDYKDTTKMDRLRENNEIRS